MHITTLPFEEIPQFSDRDKAYARVDEALQPFLKYPPTLEAFAQVIQDKQQQAVDRELLVRVLEDQYKGLEMSEAVQENIQKLGNENTFTVITAHQPSLFTGPLYYVYKIFSVIGLIKKLQQTYPDYNFVPIFISGSEDHDFEEINHAHIFGNKLVWENDETGSVGHMKTNTLGPVLAELDEIMGPSENGRKVFEMVSTIYQKNELYGRAALEMAHELFKDYGLVVVNMDQADLKRAFIPIIKKEIFEKPSQPLVEATQKALEEAGFSSQAHAREINFFYTGHGGRDRIVEQGGQYEVLNTDLQFSRDELEAEIEQKPQFFSPNVVMRPIYQEFTLPNLAYVGGGGELAYWMERQSQFEHFGINFPLLIRRNSVLWIDRSASKRMKKLELELRDLFEDTDLLIRRHVTEQADEELSLSREKGMLQQVFEPIVEKAKQVDPSLVKAIKAEEVKQMKTLEQLEGRLVRAEKQKHDTAINQLRSVKEKLFPNGGLQERYDNFLPYYLRYGDEFFEVLAANLDPLEPGLVIVLDE